MLRHFILGLLSDSRSHHGYEVFTSYRSRTGEELNPGNVYRELARLVDQGLLEASSGVAGQGSRRIPYRITPRGQHEFDRWLHSSRGPDEELPTWLLFIDRLRFDVVRSMIDRRQQALLLQGQVLAGAREEALRRSCGVGEKEGYDPLPLLLSHRMKQIAAEAEFLEEVRRHLESRAATMRDAVPEVADAEDPRRAPRAKDFAVRSSTIRR